MRTERSEKMIKKIVLATGKKSKVKEITAALSDIPEFNGITVVSMKDEGIDIDIEETGSTYIENATIKAKKICEMTGLPAMADDSGIEIDYLHGAPGVYSARFLGEDIPYSEKIQYILDELKKTDNRKCAYITAIAIAFPDGTLYTTIGTLSGLIADKETGDNGFAYDRIFYLPGCKKTMAELSFAEQVKCNQRTKALKKMAEMLKEKQKGNLK